MGKVLPGINNDYFSYKITNPFKYHCPTGSWNYQPRLLKMTEIVFSQTSIPTND